MGTRTEKKAATRESIITAARELFRRKGLLGTTTAEVAVEAVISHGALFVHFPRREDLQEEVIGRVGSEIGRAVHDAAESGSTLEDVLRSHLHAIRKEEALYARLLMEAPLLGEAARSALIGVQSAVAHHLFAEDMLGPADRAIWFNTWLGLVHHYVINRDLFAPGESVISKHGETLVTHFAGMVSRQGGRR
jgi:AcrR family transcriptional regulator